MSGLPLGIGLDRALMLRKGIDDIRTLRSDDPRIASQKMTTESWNAVSVMPPIRRDFSIVINAHEDEETLSDNVRDALGSRVDDLESVEVRATTTYDELPEQARDRLAMSTNQVNALLRIILRQLTATLTDREANQIRDTIYRTIHQSPVLELIS